MMGNKPIFIPIWMKIWEIKRMANPEAKRTGEIGLSRKSNFKNPPD